MSDHGTILLAGCGNDHPATRAAASTTTTAERVAPGEHAACVTTALSIEAAAAANFAKTGSFGTVADLVAAGYLKTAPKASWGLVVGADGTVDDSTCPS